MMMASAILLIIGFVGIVSLSLRSHQATKDLFGVPWYYRCISSDIGGHKGIFIKKDNVVGVPDAIFKHVILPNYIVGEFKSRNLRHRNVKDIERYQLQLYLGILKRTRLCLKLKGVLAFSDTRISVLPERKTFNWLWSLRNELLENRP